MDNGMVRVTLSNPEGIVTGIEYNGIDNLLEVLNEESNRGYIKYFAKSYLFNNNEKKIRHFILFSIREIGFYLLM